MNRDQKTERGGTDGKGGNNKQKKNKRRTQKKGMGRVDGKGHTHHKQSMLREYFVEVD